MVLYNRTLVLVFCGSLMGSNVAFANENHGNHPAPQSKAAQPPHASPKPAPSHVRFQRINVIDPDRAPARVDYASQGSRYHRWHIGEVLPPAIWSQRFWIADPSHFGLDNPSDGSAWVRYGPDALLVDLHNGQIVETAHGFEGLANGYRH